MREKTRNRLQLIVDYLRAGNSPSFSELLAYVSIETGEIKERQLRSLIKILRSEGINGEHYQLLHDDKSKRYSLGNDYRFQLQNLLNSEKASLPLLFGLLQPYKDFPAIGALLNNIIDVHGLEKDKLRMLSIVVGGNGNQLVMDVFKKVMKGMMAIYDQVVIEFQYQHVGDGVVKANDIQLKYVKLLPLQVRIHDGRYYLLGIRPERDLIMKNLQSFAFDTIVRGPDPFYISENDEQPQKFDWGLIAKAVNLERCYDHSFGIYRDFGRAEPPENIYRNFKGWAASFVKAVPIHPTQKIVQTSPDGSIRVRLSVYRTKELDAYFSRFGEFSWED